LRDLCGEEKSQEHRMMENSHCIQKWWRTATAYKRASLPT